MVQLEHTGGTGMVQLEHTQGRAPRGLQLLPRGSSGLCSGPGTGARERLELGQGRLRWSSGKGSSPRGCWALPRLPREWARPRGCQSSRSVWTALPGMDRLGLVGGLGRDRGWAGGSWWVYSSSGYSEILCPKHQKPFMLWAWAVAAAPHHPTEPSWPCSPLLSGNSTATGAGCE